jgi:hypothetical protein
MARLKNWFNKYSEARSAVKARKYLGHTLAKITKLIGKPTVRYYVATKPSIEHMARVNKGRLTVEWM